MNIQEFISWCVEQSISFSIEEGGQLKVHAKPHCLTEDIVSKLKERKPEILAWLEQQQVAEIPRRTTEHVEFPLSFSQQRLWVLSQVDKNSSHYNMVRAFTLSGNIQQDKVQTAFELMVNRHEVLRSTLHDTETGPVQRVSSKGAFELGYFDFSDYDDRTAEEKSTRQIAYEASYQFNLSEEPLLRVVLIENSISEFVLVINMHHIVSDALSMSILFQEFIAIYQALTEGKQYYLPELPIQYADFADWQRSLVNRKRIDRELDYWQKRLQDIPKVHALPLDHVRPPQQGFKAQCYEQLIDGDLYQQLTGFAKQQNVTLFILLQTCFAILLARFGQDNDIVMGVPNAGRNNKDVEHLIGFFINTMVVRTSVDQNLSFNGFLSQNKADLLEDFHHQDVPFELVVERLNPDRDLAFNPLCQIKFMVETREKHDYKLPGMDVAIKKAGDEHIRFDLDLSILEVDGALYLPWSFKTELFESVTIACLADAYKTLLVNVMQNPQQKISDIDIVSPKQTADLIACGKGDIVESIDFNNVIEAFVNQVGATPQNIAVSQNEVQIDYATLNSKVNRLADYLLDQGYEQGDVVAIAMERSVAMIVAMLASLKIGACYLPLDISMGKKRIASILEEANVELIIAQSASMSAIGVGKVDLLLVDDWYSDNWLVEYSSLEPGVVVSSDAPAYVIYTSGSTGTPKGVVISHYSLADYLSFASRSYFHERIEASLLVTSHCFDISVPSLYLALISGRKVDILPESDLFESLYRELHSKASLVRLTPSHVIGLLNQCAIGNQAECNVSHVFVVGGETFSLDTARALQAYFPDSQIFNHYGPTEATVGCAMYDVTSNLSRLVHTLPIGQAMDNHSLIVLDEHKQLLPKGAIGELYVCGNGLAQKYLNQPTLTAEKFCKIPNLNKISYATGDLVRWNSAGQIEYIARKDEQIKLRGYRIELGEIESALISIAGINSACVVVSEQGRLHAFVLGEGEESAVLAELNTLLPDYMVPQQLSFAEHFQYSANGKIDKRAMLSLVKGESSEQNYIAPRDEIESTLAEIWQELLSVEKVSVEDNFFNLGGDSILSIQSVARAAKQGLHYTTRNLFEKKTIAALRPLVTQKLRNSIQTPCIGSFKLLPVQREFLAETSNKHHYNQSITVEVEGRLFTRHNLSALLAVLVQRHDIMRASFTTNESGIYLSESEIDFNQVLEVVDAAGLSKEEIEVKLNGVQSALNICDGPLFKWVLLNLEGKQQLFWCSHHMIVDGVSWRILLEDLNTLWRQFSTSAPLKLANKTSSFATWSEYLYKGLSEGVFEEQQAYWQRQSSIAASVVKPTSVESKPPKYRNIRLQWDERVTENLVKRSIKAFNMRVDEILLAGILLAFNRFNGAKQLSLLMESHGRNPFDSDLDLTQTVGWFTAKYPLTIQMNGDGFEALVVSVKEQMRSVPDIGIGYGMLSQIEPALRSVRDVLDVMFNYLGQFEQNEDAKSDFSVVDAYQTANVCSSFVHKQPILLNGLLTNKKLTFEFSYNTNVLSERLADELSTHIHSAVEEVIAFCIEQQAPRLTLSDVPLAQLSVQELNQLNTSHHPLDVYPATGMQSGMLFQSKTAPEVYTNQVVLHISDLNVECFFEAWKRVVERHDVLRTAFVLLEQGYHQVVTSKALDWHFVDLTDQTSTQIEQHISQAISNEKADGFDSEQAPLMRVTVFQESDNEYRVLWTHHHTLWDGWCNSILFREVTQYYLAYIEKTVPALAAAPKYKDYIAWLSTQDRDKSLAYWRDKVYDSDVSDFLLPSLGITGGHTTSLEHTFSLALSNRLFEFGRSNQCTLNNVIQLAWAYLLSRYSGESRVCFGAVISGRPANMINVENMIGLFINTVPMVVHVEEEFTLTEVIQDIQQQQLGAEENGFIPLYEIIQQSTSSLLFDSIVIFENYPLDEALPEQVTKSKMKLTNIESFEETSAPITLNVYPGELLRCKLDVRTATDCQDKLQRIMTHFEQILVEVCTSVGQSLSTLSMLTESEVDSLIRPESYTCVDVDVEKLIHQKIDEQAGINGDAIAAVYQDSIISYGDLAAQSNRFANYLHSVGIGKGDLVGIGVSRSLDMIVAMLGVLKSGAAYVPLDLSYPIERIKHITQDAELQLIVIEENAQDIFQALSCNQLLVIDAEQLWRDASIEPPQVYVSARDLAYVIYTSGSTGLPKGVMVEHGNLVNFCSGLERSLTQGSEQAIWLATTSISFDISILELLWTLTQGNKVVIQPDKPVAVPELKETSFGLFYFAADNQSIGHKYDLLLEGAKFADTHGLSAVWVPERHFASFGDQFPNPSVAAAAIAATTNHVRIRSGSVVVPIHDPIRVAEEWSMVDNLSKGRVELSMASGWNPNDFVLAPEQYQNRHAIMRDHIDAIKSLWHGESISRINGVGKPFDVTLHPKPVQKDLSIWITAAGSPESFKYAGSIGANVLTHMLGKTANELKNSVAIYRQALVEAGYAPEHGKVALMLHTFVGEDTAEVKQIVEQPFKNYLKHHVDLRNQATEEDNLASEEGMNAVLDRAFNRFYKSSGLFGNVTDCAERVRYFRALGVDEFACLIDFGVDKDLTIRHLEWLHQLQQYTKAEVCHNRLMRSRLANQASFHELVEQHNVTHFQTTPSYVRELIHDNRSRQALSTIEQLLVGGEALDSELATKLSETVKGDIYNMYGPTETTIWSTIGEVNSDTVDIGRPIANTSLFVLDKQQRLLPYGATGELYIGGKGVTRGYLNKSQLTDERFIESSFTQEKLYKTGDLVRFQADGTLIYCGREDEQVKVSGHRIELKEIEHVIANCPNVESVVVQAHHQANSTTLLAAYIQSDRDDLARQTELEISIKSHVNSVLPHYMQPRQYLFISQWPLTANGKVDKRALPVPQLVDSSTSYAKPETEVEEFVAKLWVKILGLEEGTVGRLDNFFEHGGQSILALRLNAEIRKEFNLDIVPTQIFETPVLAEFSAKLELALSDAMAQQCNLDEINEQVASMSDEEVAAMLLELNAEK